MLITQPKLTNTQGGLICMKSKPFNPPLIIIMLGKRMMLQLAALLLLSVMAHAAGGFEKNGSFWAIKFAGYIFNNTQTVILGNAPAKLETSEAIGSCSSGGFTYQWQQSTDGVNFTNIPGANGVEYQPGVITQKMYYRRMVSCGSETAYTNVATVSVELDGGCISTKTQWLLFGNVPANINATAALFGRDPGNYSYQWQSSIDNISFIDIPGATSQNLSFSSALPQTMWFLRKTVSGDVADMTTTSVKVVMASVLYYSVVKSGTYTPNICPAGARANPITYPVNASTYVSDISQADVDAQAQADVNANGQTYANNNAVCLWYNFATSAPFVKNNCAVGGSGSTVTYPVAADVYTSGISQADADAKAQNDINTNGQTYANNNGYCTWVNAVQSGTYTKNNCQSGAIPTNVTYTVNAGAYSSTISQADADQKAINDVNANGQNNANNNGQCINVFVKIRNNGGSPGTFGFSIKNTSGTALYGKTLDSDQLPFSVAVAAQSYIVDVIAMNPMYVIINGTEKFVNTNTTVSWNTGNVVDIQVSQTALYRNVTQSATFTRNNCPSGYVGGQATISVAAGTYTSTISQADADQQAINALNAMDGQGYANTNGSCTQIQNVNVTLTNAYMSGYPNPVYVEFIQNGNTVSSGTFPNSRTGSSSMTVLAGTYTLRFTVPSSWATAPMSFTLVNTGDVWSKPMGANQTVVTTGSVTFNYGTSYTLRASGGTD